MLKSERPAPVAAGTGLRIAGAEARVPAAEEADTLLPEAREAGLYLRGGALAQGVAFREKLVGIAHELFLKRLRLVNARRQRQAQLGHARRREARSGVTLTHAGHGLVALAAHDAGAEVAVEQVGLPAVAVYAGGVGEKYAHVVEHGGTLHKSGVEAQGGMGRAGRKGLAGHLAAVVQEQAAQGVVGRIVLADDFFRSHIFFKITEGGPARPAGQMY